MGNVISGNQVRSLPLEARNVVGLLSLQAGAVYLPNTGNLDNRSGAVSGARADQANITLDGVDVNDPQFSTAYSTALRSTLDSLQEFRVTTSNYGADTGRSSSAQVSLVTKSGTNVYHGSGYGVFRRTATSTNEYFNKLSGNEVPKLDKNIYGGSFGGALIKDKLFFFGNYERLTGGLRGHGHALGAVGVHARRGADLPMRQRGAVPGRDGAGLLEQSLRSRGLLRCHTRGAGFAGPARHRPEPPRRRTTGGCSAAERPRA